MRFKVVVYNTKSANKFDAEETFEYLGDADPRQSPEDGLCGLTDCLP